MACEVERRLMWMAAGQGSVWMVELFLVASLRLDSIIGGAE